MFDFELHFFFLVIISPCNSFRCLGHFKNVYDDDDNSAAHTRLYRGSRKKLLPQIYN